MLERGCLCLLLGSLRSEHGSRIRVMPRSVPVCLRLVRTASGPASRRRRFPVGAPQRATEALAGADPELRVNLPQVPLHGAVADEQLRTNFRVGVTLAGKSRDQCFLGRELITGVVSALAHLLAGSQQLASRAICESIRAHRGENVICLAELLAGVDPPVLTTEPLAIAQPGTSEVRRHPRLPKRLDRLAVQMLGRFTILEERARARLRSLRPGRAARARPLAQLIEGFTCDLLPPAPGSRLDELAQRPR